jgi:hypothetical protein
VDPSRLIESNPFVFRMLERSVDESHFSILMSSCIDFLRAEESQERLYPDLRVEQGVALFFEYLLNHPGYQQVSLKFLMSLTGLSKRFLRKLLKEAQPWLLVRSLGRGKGWEVSINEEDSYLERRKVRMEGLLRGEPFSAPVAHLDAFSLCQPGDVEDGRRNDWIHRLALIYKWHGFSEVDCFGKVDLRVGFIPGAENSRNAANVDEIVRSIYRNHGNHFGKFAGLGLPEWMLDDSLFLGSSLAWGESTPEDCQTPTPLKVVVDEEPLALSPEPVVDVTPEVTPLVALEDSNEDPEPYVSCLPLEPIFEPGPLQVPKPMASDAIEPESLAGPVPVVLTGVMAEPSSPGVTVSPPDLVVIPNPPFKLRLAPSLPVRSLSLQKGYNPIYDPLSFSASRVVRFDGHVPFQGVLYSVAQEYVGQEVVVQVSSLQGVISFYVGGQLIETHQLSLSGRVTKPQHCLYPEKRKSRVDGLILFHGKLYSTGISSREFMVSYVEGLVTVKDLFGDIVAVHDSIQDSPRKISILPEHFDLWENALAYNSYYRDIARGFDPIVESFVVGLLNKRRGLIDASSIHRLFSLARNHDRDFFLGLVSAQVKAKDYRVRPIAAMLEKYDSV